MKNFNWHSQIEKLVKLRYVLPLAGLTVVLLAVGCWLAANKLNQKMSATMEGLTSLTENIRRSYKSRPDYWGLSTQEVVQKQLAPAGMLSEGRLISPLGDEIDVGSDENGNVVMPAMRSFYVAFKNLSEKNCVDMTLYPLSEKIRLGLLSVTVKNSDNETVFQWGGENALPIAKEKALKFCKKTNVILWNFE